MILLPETTTPSSSHKSVYLLRRHCMCFSVERMDGWMYNVYRKTCLRITGWMGEQRRGGAETLTPETNCYTYLPLPVCPSFEVTLCCCFVMHSLATFPGNGWMQQHMCGIYLTSRYLLIIRPGHRFKRPSPSQAKFTRGYLNDH